MQITETRKKDIVSFFLKNGLLINNELLEYLGDEQNFFEVADIIEKKQPENIAVLNDKIKSFINQNQDLNNTNLVGNLLTDKNAEVKAK